MLATRFLEYLGTRGDQIFQEFDRRVPMRRVGGHAGAADIDMGAAAVLVGEDDADRCRDGIVLRLVRGDQAGEVVVVGDRDIAFACRHRFDLIGIAALGVPGHVGDQAPGPGFGGIKAIGFDHRGDERLVIDIRGRANTDLAGPFRIGEILIGGDLGWINPILGVDDGPHPGAEPVPQAVGMAQVFRHRGGQRVRDDRLKEAGVNRACQPAGVDGDEQVGRAAVALGQHALDQGVALGLDQIDRDPGRLGELVIEGLVGAVVA